MICKATSICQSAENNALEVRAEIEADNIIEYIEQTIGDLDHMLELATIFNDKFSEKKAEKHWGKRKGYSYEMMEKAQKYIHIMKTHDPFINGMKVMERPFEFMDREL